MKRDSNFLQVTFSLVLPALFLTGCSGGCGSNKMDQSPAPRNEPSSAIPAITTAATSNAPVVAEATKATAASISGKIILKGTPPSEHTLSMDATCGQLHATPPTTRFYSVGDAGALADVFVAIKSGLNGKAFPPSEQPVLLDQLRCEYTPYVVGLQTGQKLLVRNSDPMMHNVHPVPKISGNKESNKAQMPKSKDYEFAFENPEVFLTFQCNVHPWMFAYVGVVEHPFFAVSGKDGTFQLKNVPDGNYVIEATHRKAGKQTKEVTVAHGASTPIEITFEITPSP